MTMPTAYRDSSHQQSWSAQSDSATAMFVFQWDIVE